MKRFAAHYLYCASSRVIAKAVIGFDENNKVLELYSLNDKPEEVHTTVFCNGILLPFNISRDELSRLESTSIFDYLDNRTTNTQESILELGSSCTLYCLENVDLVNKRFLQNSTVRLLL